MNNHITCVFKHYIININGLDIMVTLISVYFKYIKFLCKIFTKHNVPILQVYPNHLIIILKILHMTFIISNIIHIILYIYIIKLFKNSIFSLIFFKLIFYYIMMMMILK